MSSHFTEISDDLSLPLSSLRLIVSPLRLICAAIWQTVQQNVVTDYGMLEEFVTSVTNIVPELLNPKQRAQLILGLRAKVILELCRSEVTANLQNIQPHLDRLLTLAPLLNIETEGTDTELSEFNFKYLIHTVLKDPEERAHFFLNVFPKEFGAAFDAAIQGLTWEFLSKLEKLLPQPNLKKVASLLYDVHSVLVECIESISQAHGLKTLLDYYKDLSHLENSDSSIDGSCITSALCLQPVGKVVIAYEQTQSEPDTLHAYVHSLGEVESTFLQSNGVEMETETIIDVESSGKWKENVTEEQETNDCWLYPRVEVKSEDESVISEYVGDTGGPLNNGTFNDAPNSNEGAASMGIGCMAREDIHEETETVVVLEANENHNFENDKSYKRLTSLRVRKHFGKKPKNSSKQKQSLMFRAGKMPSNKHTYSLEQNRVHTRGQLFICLKCGIKFKEKFTLKKHDAHCNKRLSALKSDKQLSKKLQKGSECKRSQLLARDMNNQAVPAKRVPNTYMEEEKIMDNTMAHASSTVVGRPSYKVIDSSLYCEVCTRAVQDLETLEKHKATHTPSQCNMCEENFPLFKQLVKHYEEVHKLSRPYICTNCHESFKSLSPFIRHEWKHTGYQPYKCLYCPKRVRSFVDLLEHERVHTGEQPFLCLKCGMQFKHKHTLTKHGARCQNTSEQARTETKMQLVVKESQTDPLTAPEVATGEGIRADIIENIAERAPSVVDGTVECPNMSSRRSHESPNSTPGDISPSTATSTANESFKTPGEVFMLGNENVHRDMRDHMAAHSTTDNPLYCEVCTRVVSDLETLEKHRISHTPFQCSMCEEQFPLFKPLVKHYEDCHKVKKPFTCSYCQERLKSLPLFIRHKWKHTGHQPYKCIYCSKRVRSFVDLLEHERVHTGEKPFLCLKCGMKFKHKHTLTKHNARCHNTLDQSQTQTTIEPIYKETCINSQNSVNNEVKIKTHCLSKRCVVLLRRINTLTSAPSRPLRPNRGQRMKTFLEQERRLNKFHGATSEFQSLTPHSKILHTIKSQDPSYSRAILGKKASSKRMGKVCDLCNKEIEGNMRDHKMEHRRAATEAGEVVPRVKCNECDKAFECKMSLRAHKVTHNRLYCEVCTRMVQDSKTLEKHRVTHTQFQCNMCKESFRLLKHLVTHYEDLHKLNEPYVCTHCQESCKTVKHLIKHEWKHTGHQPFKCLYCPKTIRSYADLTEHERVHTKEQPFLCWTCGNGFKHKHTLEKHVVRCQNLPSQSKKTYICAQCGNTYKCMSSLLYHEQSRHKGVRYPCTHCGKGFFSSFALVRHILIHTGEKPYKCQYGDCNKSFRSPSEVRLHTRYHTGEKPYKCHFCGKGFVQACTRTLHIRSHTGERPYPCSVCDKRFNSFHGLKQHKKIHAQVIL